MFGWTTDSMTTSAIEEDDKHFRFPKDENKQRPTNVSPITTLTCLLQTSF